MKPMNLSQRAAALAGIDTVLRAAGAHNWTAEAIEAHKRSELAKAPPANFWWKSNEALNGLMPLALCAQALLAMLPPFLLPENSNPALTLFLAGWQMASLAFFIWGVFFATARGPAKWNLYRLILETGYWSSQTRQIEIIPEEARKLVANILALRPNAKFEVAALEQETYRLDPILYAIVDGEKIPVIVWDENEKVVKPPV